MGLILVLIFANIVHLGRGGYYPLAPLLTILFLIWAGATWLNRSFKWLDRISERALPWIPLYFAILIGAFDRSLDLWMRITYLVLILLLTLFRKRLGERLSFFLHGVIALGLYLGAVAISPNPFIDVFRSNRQAVLAFLSGLNPYTQSYPDIYQGAYGYTPGFAYWPAILYIQSLSQLIFHDIRVLLVMLWWGVPFFFRDRSSSLGLVWWGLPFLPFGFEQAWIDPALSAFFALLLWYHLKGSKFLPLFFASLAAATKQYGGLIGLSFCLFLLRSHRFREVAVRVMILGGFFLLWMLPLVLLNPAAFRAMTIDSHLLAAVRTDALNFTAFWFRVTGNLLSGKVQLFAVLWGLLMGGTHVLLRYRSRGIRVVPEASAMIFGFSMLFGKFAFCNYHWLLISFVILTEWLQRSAQSFTKEAT